MNCLSRNSSKNQVVCARCHFVGLASGMDCTHWSSADRAPASLSVSCRTRWYRSIASESNDRRARSAICDILCRADIGGESLVNDCGAQNLTCMASGLQVETVHDRDTETTRWHGVFFGCAI